MEIQSPPNYLAGSQAEASLLVSKSRLNSTAKLLLALHAALVVVLIVLLELAPEFLHTNLIRWDSVWYDAIRLHGYTYRANAMSSVAFFPLFPYLWRISTLGPIGICLLNLTIFAGALTLLYKQLQLRPVAVLLYTAFPSSLFFYLPYTEAVFFLASSLVLVGVGRQSKQAMFGGMLLGAFARVTSFFYLPALFVVEAVQVYVDPESLGKRLQRMFLYGSLTGLGLATVMLIHWAQTGVWFAFNKTQGAWDHHLRLPSFPFVSNTSTSVAWLDGMALLVGVAAAGWVVRTIVRVVRRQADPPPATVLFAAVLAASALHTLAFAPLAPESGTTSLMSMHRYVFGTPFFLILLNEFIPWQRLSLQHVGWGLLLVLGLAAALGFLNLAAVELNVMRKPLAIPGLLYTSLILAYAYLWLRTDTRWGKILVYGSSIFLQIVYCYLQTLGVWIA